MAPGATGRTGDLQIGDNDVKPTSLEHPDHTKVSSQQVTAALDNGVLDARRGGDSGHQCSIAPQPG